MSSPFWSFDPFVVGFNILFILSILFFTFPVFNFLNCSKTSMLIKTFKNSMAKLFPTSDFFSNGLISMLSSFFVVMCCINLTSLFSYSFAPLAHVMMAIMMSFTLWLSSFLYQVIFFLKNKTIHLVPKGTPGWLLFFMVMIELVSQLIRPITLGVRLAANLTAGHLILTLLASISFFSSIIAQFPLMILELVVSLVQPFVFCLLIFLYFMET